MPNYNQTLQTNNSSLEEIITQLNNMPDAGGGGTPVEQATPTITLNTTTGLITATATQAEGYVAAGTKSATYQLAFQAAQTITPGTTNKTIPANTYLGGVQTIKGDVNLVASNIVSGKSIFGVVGTATAGGGGGSGDTSVEDSLVTRTVTAYTNNRITNLASGAFAYAVDLTTINAPNCTNIGDYAFMNCYALSQASFSLCTNIGSCAFQSCSSLTTISFPKCITIGQSAFAQCSKISEALFPQCTSIAASAFVSCSSLSNLSFPKCTSIGTSAFHYCRAIQVADFPKCTQIGGRAFWSCYSLTRISIPECLSITGYAFWACSRIASVSLPKCTFIGNAAFSACSSLSTIYLGASNVCQLENSNVFSKTSIWSNKGSIFVPASLLASYKAASHWSYFSNRIFSYAF